MNSRRDPRPAGGRPDKAKQAYGVHDTEGLGPVFRQHKERRLATARLFLRLGPIRTNSCASTEIDQQLPVRPDQSTLHTRGNRYTRWWIKVYSLLSYQKGAVCIVYRPHASEQPPQPSSAVGPA